MNKLTINIKKVSQFLFKGMVYSPATIFNYFLSFFTQTNLPKVNFLSDTELSNEIENGKSIVRFGDGEVMIMTGRDIHFQKSSLGLSRDLKKIINGYNKNSDYIICLPLEATKKTLEELKNLNRLKLWRLFRVFFKQKLRNDLTYGDAHTFYHKKNLTEMLIPKLKDRHVIAISRADTIDNNFEKIINEKSSLASFIIAPEKNAYKCNEEIKKNIEKELQKNTKYKPLLLVAIGPASKPIVFSYANKGIQSIDIGHGMEILAKDLDYTDRT